jgi:GNAT superfamily N-acetyltransferase
MVTPEAALRADPHLVEAWVHGWALARGAPLPVPEHGGWRIEVGLPQHRRRTVFPQLLDTVRDWADSITEPYDFLKICAPPAAVRALLPPRWSLPRLGFMMTMDLSVAAASARLPAGYALDLLPTAHGATATIIAPTGEVAADGGIARIGAAAIFDQIGTRPEHRRLGLGRALMAALQAAARDSGASQGLLVATPEGRMLYAATGWTLHVLYTTAVLPEVEG